MSRVSRTLGVELPLRSLFESATVARLGERIDAARAESGATAGAQPIRRIARGETLPLSFAELRLWLLEHIDQVSGLYNVVLAQHLRGALDAEVVRRSIDEIVRR